MTTIPSKEAITYSRGVIQREIDKFRRFSQQALDKGESVQAREWRIRANMLEMTFIGSGEGCVIRPFDKRWLDDDFRALMSEVYERVGKDDTNRSG